MVNNNTKRIISIVMVTSITLLLAAISMFVIVGSNENSDGIEYIGTIISPTLACIEIGNSILKRNGSAVDAALAALFCENAINLESIDRSQGFVARIYTYNKQQWNANNATLNVDSRYIGTLYEFSILHKLYGKLDWEDIIAPAIEIFNKSSPMNQDSLDARPLPRVAATIRPNFLDELVSATKHTIRGSNFSREHKDLIIQRKIGNHIVYSANELFLNILLNLSQNHTNKDVNLLWHRMIEAFKYAYSLQKQIDTSFLWNQGNLLQNASNELTNKIFIKIRDDNATFFSDEGKYYSDNFEFNFWNLIAIDMKGQIFSLGNGMSKVPENMNKTLQSKFQFERLSSAMEPLFIIKSNDNSKLIIIFSNPEPFSASLLQVLIRYLLLGETLTEAMCSPRLYYNSKTMQIQYDVGFNQSILESLKLKGHFLKPIPHGRDSSKFNSIRFTRSRNFEREMCFKKLII